MSTTFLQDVISTAAAPILTVGKAISDNFINPATARLQSIGRNGSAAQAPTRPVDIAVRFRDQNSTARSRDWRVRITLSKQADIFYQAGDAAQGILAPLRETNGIVFPYTPQITVTHQAQYSQQRYTHSNYPQNFYEHSEIQSIQIRGEFTAQTPDEASYVLACIYFFRAATKMFFAESGKYTGNPPPLVYLNGYGDHYFPNVPCVITQFSHDMPADVDYMESKSQAITKSFFAAPTREGAGEFETERQTQTSLIEGTRVPTASTITLNLQPTYSRRRLTEFNLNDFAQGRLIDKGFI